MLDSLNTPQEQAVQTTDGPLLVLACAGTGKTKVLTSRIINIVNSHLASPLQILAVTFTNKAAAEMRNRIGQVIGDQVNNLWIGTFHSVAARILRRHPEVVGLSSDFTIIDDDDQKRLLKQILNDLNVDIKQFPPKAYLGKISRLKDKGTLSSSLNKSGEDLALPKLKNVYEIYQTRLKAMNAADFGDLLLYNLEIFKSAPDILAYYQDKFRYVLVDEYQDTNNVQYQWLLSLSSTHQNICCVGDDDQSIYSWRGANVANILRFEKDFANAKVIRLEQNYRSTSRILDAAHAVISNNKERHGKKLWTDVGEGEKVKILSFLDDRSEAATIATTVRDFIASNKYPTSQIAILVRAGYQTRSFEEAFIATSIPYKVIGGMKFYERLEIRDSIAYLRICANTADNLALSRIINVPKRGVGNGALTNLYEKSKQEGFSLFDAIKKSLEEGSLKGKSKESLAKLFSIIEKFNEQIGEVDLSKLAKELLSEVGYLEMWKSENTLEAQGRIENIEEFINSLADFSSMTEFLEYVSLVEARDEKNAGEAVSIMTVHGAKGLEFDAVFVPGLEDGVFPSGRSLDERNGLEEERRLMYVAITRARKKLTLSFAKSRYVFGDVQMQIPSRFIKELPEHEVDFEEVFFGNEHQSFGRQNNFSSGGGFRQSQNNNFGQKSKFSAGSLSQTKFLQNQFAKTPKPSSNSSQSGSLEGKRVFHQKFGYGMVIGVSGNKLDIMFEKTGMKTVMKDFVTAA